MAKPHIKIPLSSSDLEDLQAGESFDWTFETDKGESIDVHLFNEDLKDDDNEEDDY